MTHVKKTTSNYQQNINNKQISEQRLLFIYNLHIVFNRKSLMILSDRPIKEPQMVTSLDKVRKSSPLENHVLTIRSRESKLSDRKQKSHVSGVELFGTQADRQLPNMLNDTVDVIAI